MFHLTTYQYLVIPNAFYSTLQHLRGQNFNALAALGVQFRVMHHQLRSLLTENTFKGTTKGMQKGKESSETANKFHIFEKIAKKHTLN